jgi:hypothetical protein
MLIGTHFEVCPWLRALENFNYQTLTYGGLTGVNRREAYLEKDYS